MSAADYFNAKPQIALAEAAASGDTAKIDGLIAGGININATGRSGMTAVVWAFLHENKRGFGYLLQHGANPNFQLTETIDDVATAGNSATSFAARHEDVWYLKEVLKYGGNPNLVNPVNTLTPIYESIRAYRLESVKLLIDTGADLNAQDKNGVSPIVAAAMANRYDMAYAMLDAGAKVAIADKWGYTILRPIKNTRTDPKSPMYQWKQKVIDFLKAKGVDLENGK